MLQMDFSIMKKKLSIFEMYALLINASIGYTKNPTPLLNRTKDAEEYTSYDDRPFQMDRGFQPNNMDSVK